ncbi:hypothetical protein N2152v2_003737 [Parachlorella kessleri]
MLTRTLLAAATTWKWYVLGQVLMLEKEPRTGGNSAWANSGINFLTPEEGDSPSTFKADTLESGGGLCKPELDSSQDAQQFLAALGVDLGGVAQTGGQSVPRTHSPPAGGPAVGEAIMAALQRSVAQQANVEVRTGLRVTGLSRSEGTSGSVWHVKFDASGGTTGAGTGSGSSAGSGAGTSSSGTAHSMHSQPRALPRQESLQAQAVVLATGGFAASQALLERYAPYAAGLGTTNGGFATGEGLLLAQQAGAAAVDLQWVQLNPTGIVEPHGGGDGGGGDGGPKTVAPEKLRGLGAILLNSEGRRFVNELGRRDEVAGAILQQPHQQAVLLLGSQTAAQFGPAALEPYLSQGLMQRAENLQQLAAATAMPEQRLREELEGYNLAAAAGRDAFGKTAFLAPIDLQGPLVWVRVAPVAHYCMGGVAVDSRAQVLGEDGRHIPGLFAAGEVAGGVHGKNLLVGNSLLECIVFGKIAGTSAAAYALHTP